MIRTVWRVLRNNSDAEDALQEAMIILWKKRNDVKKHPNPKAFILRVCHNSAFDVLRKRMRDSSRHTDMVDEPEVLDTVRDELMDQQTIQQIQEAISTLPRHQAAALMMRMMHEESYEHIAEALGCSEATARVHVNRGKTALQQQLNGLLQTG